MLRHGLGLIGPKAAQEKRRPTCSTVRAVEIGMLELSESTGWRRSDKRGRALLFAISDRAPCSTGTFVQNAHFHGVRSPSCADRRARTKRSGFNYQYLPSSQTAASRRGRIEHHACGFLIVAVRPLPHEPNYYQARHLDTDSVCYTCASWPPRRPPPSVLPQPPSVASPPPPAAPA